MNRMMDGKTGTDRNTKRRIDEGQIASYVERSRGGDTATARLIQTVLSAPSGLAVMKNVLSAPTMTNVR